MSYVFGFTTREDLAWAAGLWDGEGCFSGKPILVNTDIELLDRFRLVFGFGVIRKRVVTGNRKQSYLWTTTRFKEAQFIVASMWEWLSEKRKTQATKMLRSLRAKGLERDGSFCQKALHRMEGDNVLTFPRANRPGGKPYRRCRACLEEWHRCRKIRELQDA
jgi:hypothetical protein